MYRIPPVGMKEFLENPYYLGGFNKTLFHTVKLDLIEIFENDYTQAIFGGSLGGGKSTAGVIALVRMVYEASCLRDPHETYGISKSDYIMFPGVSSTEDVAERNILDKVRAIVRDSDYFQNEFRPEKDSLAKGILFPNKILIPPGASSSSQILGGNVGGLFIDEGNFFQKRSNGQTHQDAKENVEVIYEAIIRRMESRFKRLGRIPGIIVVSSSKTTPNAFTERLIQKSLDKPQVYVRERSVWETQSSSTYSGKKFRVAIGTETRMSKILIDGESDPEGMKVIDVPEEFKEAFEDDIDGAIRDHAGYSTVSITPFIARREKIYECITKERSHPFTQEVWEQSIPGRIEWNKLCKLKSDGTYEPIWHPSAPRHVHLDLSKNHDRTGIVVSCVAGYAPVQRFGKTDVEMAPTIHIDLSLAIQSPIGGEIVYAEIRKLIYEFSQHGFYIKMVTADQFQSLSMLQQMRQQGYKTKVVSVEPAGGPYELLKQALYEGRISMYNYPPLTKELRELQKNWKTGKVDHPDSSRGGSKDISDALASCIATLTESAYGIVDEPLLKRTSDILMQNDDDWILDGMYAVNNNDSTAPDWRKNAEEFLAEEAGQIVSSQPEWRQHAEKALEQADQSSYDWKRNFQMPFMTG